MTAGSDQPFIRRTMLVRMALLVGVWCVFDHLPLRPGQQLERDVVAGILGAAGYKTALIDADAAPTVVVNGHPYRFTAECTYIDLVLLLLVFLWDGGLGTVANGFRCIIVASLVLSVNLIRVTLALCLNIAGVSWFLSHDVPDMIIFYPTVCAFFIWRLRCDRCKAVTRITVSARAEVSDCCPAT